MRWGYATGIATGRDPFIVAIPQGSLMRAVSVVSNALTGSWIRLGNRDPVFIPANRDFSLGAAELEGFACHSQESIWIGSGLDGANPPWALPVVGLIQSFIVAWEDPS